MLWAGGKHACVIVWICSATLCSRRALISFPQGRAGLQFLHSFRLPGYSSQRESFGAPDVRVHVCAGAALLFASAPQSASSMGQIERDPQWPGTSVPRLRAITDRILSLDQSKLDGPWPEVRRKLLWAGGKRAYVLFQLRSATS